jgi:MFS transporter, putative metabolite:H+ symporter
MMGFDITMRAETPMTPTIAARLDRLPVTRRHILVVVIVGIGMFFDLYEVFLAGTLSTVFKTKFAVSPDDLKIVLASAFIGAFVGAVLLSRLADRLGRRKAFFLTLGVYSIFSVLAAFSPNVWWLIVCRFIAGIGIGGELPLCDAYLSDVLPARVRGRLIGWAYTVGFCAVPAAGFLAQGIAKREIAGIDGWRWMFVIGGLGAAICWALRRLLPESPRWLEAVGRAEEADVVTRQFEDSARRSGAALPEPALTAGGGVQPRLPLRSLFEPRWRRRTVMLWIFQCLQTLGYYGFGTLVPLILTQKGFDVVTSLGYSAVIFLGYPIGSLLSLPILERIERRTLIIGSALAMTVLGLAFGFSSGSTAILVAGFLYTAASNVFSNAYHVYQGELYPTRLRATGAGSAYSLSRLATAVMPFVLLPLLDNHGSGAVFVCIGAAMILLSVDIGLLGPRTTGKALEEVATTGPAAEAAQPAAGLAPRAAG